MNNNVVNVQELPNGWIKTYLGQIVEFNYGKGLVKANRDGSGIYKVFGSNGVVGLHTNYLVEKPCLIVGRKGAAGEVHISYEPCWPIDTTYFVLPSENFNLRFIYYLVKNLNLSQLDKSTAIPGLNRDDAYKKNIPLPPLPEQHRIVAKLEELFTKLDVSVAELKKAKAQIKRYRQSVLKSAFEGRLTEQWRIANGELRNETAEELLAKIKEERKKALGNKYKELSPVDTTNLTQLPAGWKYISLEQICYQIGDVDHRMPKAQEHGIPYISPKDFIENGEIDFDKAKKISDEDYALLVKKIKPVKGDILLSRYGTIGEVREIKTDELFQASYSICIIKPVHIYNEKYLIYYFQSDICKQQIKKYVRGVTQLDLGVTHIREFNIPFPTLEEQESVISEIERHFSVADASEKIIDQSLKQAERLRQSILKDAFTGKLVPQDPNDEPAEKLLERIKTEREKSFKTKSNSQELLDSSERGNKKRIKK